MENRVVADPAESLYRCTVRRQFTNVKILSDLKAKTCSVDRVLFSAAGRSEISFTEIARFKIQSAAQLLRECLYFIAFIRA